MKLSYFPQFKVIHTSKTFHHQLYIPLANWLLMIGTIIVASVYKNTTALGNAYGVCVMFVTFFDTCMVSLAGMFVWRISPLIIILPFLTIASLDGAYLSSSLMKVPHGAWVTIVIATVLALIFLLWRYGKEQQWFAEAEDRFQTSHFVTREPSTPDESGGSTGTLLKLSERFGGGPLGSMKGLTVFFDKAGETTPIVFSQFLLKFTVLPDVIVLLHLRPLEVPSVPADDRFTVSRLSIPNAYRLVVRYGYNDEIITESLAGAVATQIRDYLAAQRNVPETIPAEEAQGSQSSTLSRISHGATESALDRLDRAYAHNVVYIMGKEQMKIKPKTNLLRRFVLWIFLWVRENTRGKMSALALPVDRVIEVGFLKEI
jgi:KUP system potassium uptake protein